MALYSASVVLSATSDCSFEAQIIGHSAYVTTNPDRDLAIAGSSLAVTLSQFPTKSASTQQLNDCCWFGFRMSPLSNVPRRYFPILLTAVAWDAFGSCKNCAH